MVKLFSRGFVRKMKHLRFNFEVEAFKQTTFDDIVCPTHRKKSEGKKKNLFYDAMVLENHLTVFSSEEWSSVVTSRFDGHWTHRVCK